MVVNGELIACGGQSRCISQVDSGDSLLMNCDSLQGSALIHCEPPSIILVTTRSVTIHARA
jgi:hypothetical protein